MTFKELENLTDEEVRQNLAGNPDTCGIADIYSEALAAKNTIVAVAAQDELARREDYDLISSRFEAACQTVGIELGTDFSDQLARSFIRMKSEPRAGLSKQARTKELLDSVKLVNAADCEAYVETQRPLRRYGKYTDLSPTGT